MGGQELQITHDEVIYVLSLRQAKQLLELEGKSSGRLSKKKDGGSWKKAGGAVARQAAEKASTISDINLARKLAADLGSATGRAAYKSYGGKLHIILKGRPGLRKLLTGTKYGVANPKVVNLGLGPVGVRSTLRSGAILSIVLLTGYNIIEYVLKDDVTLMSLVGQIASDVVKVGVATGASVAAAAALGTTGVIASFALGPLVVAILIGVGTAMILDAIDDRFQLTQKLKTCLNKAADSVAQRIQEAKELAERSVLDLTADLIEHLAREATEAAMRTVGKYLRQKLYDLTWANIR